MDFLGETPAPGIAGVSVIAPAAALPTVPTGHSSALPGLAATGKPLALRARHSRHGAPAGAQVAAASQTPVESVTLDAPIVVSSPGETVQVAHSEAALAEPIHASEAVPLTGVLPPVAMLLAACAAQQKLTAAFTAR
jgi:hypothetical protein